MVDAQLLNWTLSTSERSYDLHDDLQKEIVLHEMTECRFTIKVNSAQKITLTLGDFDIGLRPVSNNNGVVTYSSDEIQCFRNFIGYTHADLYLHESNRIYTSVGINIYARKITYERALSFLRMIDEKAEISSICFAVTKLNSDSKKSSRNITAMLNAGMKALDYFQQNRARFVQFPCSNTLAISKTENYKSSTHLDDRSIAYICNHPDTLQPSYFYDRDIAIGNRNYTINQIETSSHKKNTDIIENQIISGFIQNFSTYLKNLMIRIAKYKSSPKSFIEFDNESYVSIDRLLIDSGLILSFHEDKIKLALKKCKQCLHFIQQKIPCKIINGTNVLPIPTQQVLARTHYLQLYGLIKSYYDIGDPQWRGQLEFFGLRNLYKIYEFVCLIYLIDSVKKIGFTPKQADYLDNEYNPLDIRPINEPNNYYLFTKDDFQVELFYEPKAVNAYRLRQSNQRACLADLVHKNSRTWEPDFALVVNTGSSVSVHVFDAKYSSVKAVQNTHLPDVDWHPNGATHLRANGATLNCHFTPQTR